MQKRRFRQRVGAKQKRAQYPTLDQLDRRGFLSRVGRALAGAATLGAGLAACDGRAVEQGSGDAGVAPKEDWAMAGTDQPPDAGPSPDAWELLGGATPENIPPRPPPDMGPDADSEEWEWDGFAGPPPPRVDAGPDAE